MEKHMKRTQRSFVLTQSLWILLLGAGRLFPASAEPALVLFDFKNGLESVPFQVQDARVVPIQWATGPALRVLTGHDQPWPGLTLRAPDGSWDLSRFEQVELTVRNTGSEAVTVHGRADNPGADGVNHCVTGSLDLSPGGEGTLKIRLKRASDAKLEGKLFGMRGYPVAPGGPHTVNASNLTQLILFLNRPAREHVFEVGSIRAAGAYTPPTAWVTDADPFFPFIDTFGQYRHRDWPGKTHSLAEIKTKREREARDIKADPGPTDWDRFGGWTAGPRLDATGYFRTEKVDGRWWLVDPDGRLFWSQGIDCVRMMDVTPIEERGNWFQGFPGDDPEFKPFLAAGAYALKGHYAGRSPRCFSFAGANLERKYGAGWRESYPGFIQQRLRHWGLNTIGNWSDEETRLLRKTPYTDAISSGRSRKIEGSEGYWGKFPDPFDPGFREQLRRSMAGKKNRSAGDPWCLGYFSDNEMAWGDETSLAAAALRSPSDQAAKKAFLAELQTKYGTVAKLNDAWGTRHTSWEALRECREAPDPAKARQDLTAFYSRIAERYFQTAREVIREAAPHQLYLGCRFAWINPRATAAAAKYCDVVSFNLYRRDVAGFHFNGGADVPLLIGEFHFGALDRGMFHTGLVPVASQAERAAAYRNYVEGALRHPQFVGCHWFQYMDEPTTGRVYDEENYQIGFVDVADTPYRETVEACRNLGNKLYRIRSGQR
jgi:Beta-galactosidase